MMQEWFKDAKFGIVIHWGIYSAGDTSESWAFFNGDLSYTDYMAQAATFTADKYDPIEWASLFADAGAQYAVLTTKHHDGFALWDTKLSKLNAKDASPAGRDLIGPYCDALRKKGLHVGLYFSHLDWSHLDYRSVWPVNAQHRKDAEAVKPSGQPFAYPVGRAEDPAGWQRFIQFHRGQLKELCTRYSPELLWFDGHWERDDVQWNFQELSDQLHTWSPGVILNNRMGKFGDYGTPEQSVPIQKPPGVWEFCVTMNDSWGYNKKDRNIKSVRQCVRMLAECSGMGGNLLLDVGPKSDGTIPEDQVATLKGIGRWLKKHGEAIYGSVAGLPPGHFYGPSTMNKAGDVIYLVLFDIPRDEI
ncbi:MAG: alpha-L-fucosidase, partial [Planctomycetota bacterium]